MSTETIKCEECIKIFCPERNKEDCNVLTEDGWINTINIGCSN